MHIELSQFKEDHQSTPDVRVCAKIENKTDQLDVSFLVSGPVSRIHLPTLSHQPLFQQDLWKHTCFEIFIKQQNSPRYWEWNFSPSGDWWNQSFEAYRKASANNQLAPPLHTEFFKCERELRLAASILLPCESPEVLVAAILFFEGGQPTYWAKSHPRSEPDFHAPKGFFKLIEGS